MYIEKIFDYIRKEEMVLWVGSGFSKYAGFPMASELSNKIYDSLTQPEKNSVDANLKLPELAEEYIRCKAGSRNQLNGVLREVFKCRPSSVKWHKEISKIPHIQTIITTNYDDLFERCYGREAVKIIEQEDIANLGNKVEIFKVHGDIEKPSSIIISKSDYVNFFKKDTGNNLLWLTITERVSTNAVLFIGYNFEDENVTIMFEKIWDVLKENKKEVFLIAPDLKKHKENFLSQKGIQYINSKGETFIKKLIDNIRENVKSDFDKGLVKTETFQKYLSYNGLTADLKGENNKFSISAIRATKKNSKGSLTFNFKNDKVFLNKFKEFMTGKQFGEFEIDGSKVTSLNANINRINILKGEAENEWVFILKSLPIKKGKADITFDDGFEVESLSFEVFASHHKIQTQINIHNSFLIFDFENINPENRGYTINFKYEQKQKFRTTSEAILIFGMLSRLSESMPFKIYSEQLSEVVSLNPKFVDGLKDDVKNQNEYYNKLKEVENKFKLRFKDIGAPTRDNFNKIIELLDFEDEREKTYDWDEEMSCEVDANYDAIAIVKQIEEANSPIRVKKNNKEIIELYGNKIELGYEVIDILEPFVANKNDFNKGEGDVLRIKSAIKKLALNILKITTKKNELYKTEGLPNLNFPSLSISLSTQLFQNKTTKNEKYFHPPRLLLA